VVWRQYRIRSVFSHEIKKKWKKLRKVTQVELYEEAMEKVSGARKLAARNALASRRKLQIFGDVGSGSDSEDDEDEALDSPSAAAAAQMFSEFEQPAREFADVSDEEEEVKRGRKFTAAEDRQVSAEWEAPHAPKLRKGRGVKQAAVPKRLEELAKPHIVTKKKGTTESPTWGAGRARRARMAGKVSVALKPGQVVDVSGEMRAARTLHDLAKKTEMMQSAVRNFQKLDGVLEEWVTANRGSLDAMVATGDTEQLDSMGEQLMTEMEEKYRAGEFLVAVAAMWKSLKKSLLSAQKALHVIPEPEEDSPAPSPDEPDHEARAAAFQRSRTLAKSRKDELQLMVYSLDEGQETKLWHHISQDLSASSVAFGRVDPFSLVRRSVVKVNKAKEVLGKLAAQKRLPVTDESDNPVFVRGRDGEMEHGTPGANRDVADHKTNSIVAETYHRAAAEFEQQQGAYNAGPSASNLQTSLAQQSDGSPVSTVDAFNGDSTAFTIIGDSRTSTSGIDGVDTGQRLIPSRPHHSLPTALQLPTDGAATAVGSLTSPMSAPRSLVSSPQAVSPASAPLDWGRRLSMAEDEDGVVVPVPNAHTTLPSHGPSPLSHASAAPMTGQPHQLESTEVVHEPTSLQVSAPASGVASSAVMADTFATPDDGPPGTRRRTDATRANISISANFPGGERVSSEVPDDDTIGAVDISIGLVESTTPNSAASVEEGQTREGESRAEYDASGATQQVSEGKMGGMKPMRVEEEGSSSESTFGLQPRRRRGGSSARQTWTAQLRDSTPQLTDVPAINKHVDRQVECGQDPSMPVSLQDTVQTAPREVVARLDSEGAGLQGVVAARDVQVSPDSGHARLERGSTLPQPLSPATDLQGSSMGVDDGGEAVQSDAMRLPTVLDDVKGDGAAVVAADMAPNQQPPQGQAVFTVSSTKASSCSSDSYYSASASSVTTGTTFSTAAGTTAAPTAAATSSTTAVNNTAITATAAADSINETSSVLPTRQIISIEGVDSAVSSNPTEQQVVDIPATRTTKHSNYTNTADQPTDDDSKVIAEQATSEEVAGEINEVQLPSPTARNIAQLPPMAPGGPVLPTRHEAAGSEEEGLLSSSVRRSSDTAVVGSSALAPAVVVLQRPTNSGTVHLEPLLVPDPTQVAVRPSPLSPSSHNTVDAGAAVLLSSPSPSKPSPVSQLEPLEVSSPTGSSSSGKRVLAGGGNAVAGGLSPLSPPSNLSALPLHPSISKGSSAKGETVATKVIDGGQVTAEGAMPASPFSPLVNGRNARGGKIAEGSETGAELSAAASAPAAGPAAVVGGAKEPPWRGSGGRKQPGALWGTSLQQEEEQAAAMAAASQRRAILEGMRRGRTEDGAISGVHAPATRSERGGFSGMKPKAQHAQAAHPLRHSDDSVLDRPAVRPPSPATHSTGGVHPQSGRPAAGGVAPSPPLRSSAASRLRGGGGTQSQRQLATGAPHHSALQSASLRNLAQLDSPVASGAMQGKTRTALHSSSSPLDAAAQGTVGANSMGAYLQPTPMRSLHDLAALDSPGPPPLSTAFCNYSQFHEWLS